MPFDLLLPISDLVNTLIVFGLSMYSWRFLDSIKALVWDSWPGSISNSIMSALLIFSIDFSMPIFSTAPGLELSPAVSMNW